MDEEDPLAGFAVVDVSSDEADEVETKSCRTGQSEEAWQAIQKEYTVKVENGNIYQNIKLPLGPGVSKMDIQEAVHSVEEHYFFRRYNEAEQLAIDILAAGDGLDKDSRQLLEEYQAKCYQKKKTA